MAQKSMVAIPWVGQLTALAFVTAIDDPSYIRRSETPDANGSPRKSSKERNATQA
jgi:hypothetical protein